MSGIIVQLIGSFVLFATLAGVYYSVTSGKYHASKMQLVEGITVSKHYLYSLVGFGLGSALLYFGSDHMSKIHLMITMTTYTIVLVAFIFMVIHRMFRRSR